jgi:hypothetical protein
MVATIVHLQRLSVCGIGFHSHTKAHLATDNELSRNILSAVLTSLAKVEAQKDRRAHKGRDGASGGQW